MMINEPPRGKPRGIPDGYRPVGRVQSKETPQAAEYCTPVHNKIRMETEGMK